MRISSLTLLTGESIPLTETVVIVGANDTGKTTLLREIAYSAIAGEYSQGPSRWIRSCTLSSLNESDDARAVLTNLVPITGGAYRIRVHVPQAILPIDSFTITDALLESIRRLAAGETLNVQPLQAPPFRHAFTSYEPCDPRLGIAAKAEVTQLTEPPVDFINALWRDKAQFDRISDEIFKMFGVHLVLLDFDAKHLELGTARNRVPEHLLSERNPETRYSQIHEWRSTHFTPINECGHGIRATIRLLSGIVAPISQIVVIDEPELHLYPSQRRALGRLLARTAGATAKQAVIATHDPSLLQGILEARPTSTILRTDFDPTGKRIVLPGDALESGSALSRLTQRELLTGLFARHAIVVEGATDRAFYEALKEQFAIANTVECGFVAASGDGDQVTAAVLYYRLRVPFIAILDFDFLLPTKRTTLKKLLAIRGEDQLLSSVLDAVRYAIETVGVQEAALARAGLRADGLTKEAVSMLSDAIAALATVGVEIVPFGSLECWLKDGKEKARFPERAIEAFCADKSLAADAVDFLAKAIGRLNSPRRAIDTSVTSSPLPSKARS